VKSSNFFKWASLSIILLQCFASIAIGELMVTGRFSQHRFDYVYGFGGDTVSGNDNRLESDLLAMDSFNTSFHGENSGFYSPLGQGWFSSVDILMEHNYQMSGSSVPGAVNQIEASGLTQVTTVATGIGSAGGWATNPGNELNFYFTVTNDQVFQINGQIASSYSGPGDQGQAFVLLQRFDSFAGWVFGGFYSSFLPDGGVGAWSANGLMTPGDYRLVSGAFERALGNQSFTSSYNYSFSAVPEPGSIVLGLPLALLFGSNVLLRRNRKAL
jgi:hypothetical protein